MCPKRYFFVIFEDLRKTEKEHPRTSQPLGRPNGSTHWVDPMGRPIGSTHCACYQPVSRTLGVTTPSLVFPYLAQDIRLDLRPRKSKILYTFKGPSGRYQHTLIYTVYETRKRFGKHECTRINACGFGRSRPNNKFAW